MYLGTAAHSVTVIHNLARMLTDPQPSQPPVHIHACLHQRCGRRKATYPYVPNGAQGPPGYREQETTFRPSTASGSDVKRKFSNQDRSSEPSRARPAQGADGSLAGTPERMSRRRETSALPPPHLGAGSPSVSVWESVSLIQSKSPCPLSIPIHAGREDPHLHLHRPRHTIAQRGVWPRVPASRGTAAQQRRRSKNRSMSCTQVSFPLPCPALQKSNTTQLNKQLPTPTHGKTGAHRYTHPRTTHTRAQQQQHNRPAAATTTRDHHPRRSAWAPGHRGLSNGKPFSFLPGPTPLPPRSQGCFLALS